MEILVWIGAALSVIGLAGIIGCALAVARARRRAGDDDAALRDELRRIVAWNLGALFVSAFGLIMVAVGVILA